MPITIRRNTVEASRVTFVTKEDMAAVGQLVRQRIIERTARGVDAKGRPFTPYSPAYRDLKREQLGSTGVTLTVSGEMLRAMTIEATEKRVRIAFAR